MKRAKRRARPHQAKARAMNDRQAQLAGRGEPPVNGTSKRSPAPCFTEACGSPGERDRRAMRHTQAGLADSVVFAPK